MAQSLQAFQPVTLPTPKWTYTELQPVLSENLLSFHHGKHHQAYVNNVNTIYGQIQEALNKNDFATVDNLQKNFKFNLGGHLNHALFWENLAPNSKGGGQLPAQDSQLAKAIVAKWGSFDNFIAEFNKRATGIQGSGWEFLGYDIKLRALRLYEVPNQELPEQHGFIPLLTIDVWEHAYYLDYQNLRAKFLTEVWKIVNWKDVEARYLSAIQ